MKLKQLEIHLQKIEGFTRPSPRWEQYQTPAPLAARLLFHAHSRGDIGGKRVCDLGCGTGILSIGAVILGASHVTGYDIDENALDTARKNAENIQVSPVFIAGDISDPSFASTIRGYDTVIMNPPFGAQVMHADRPFIDTALQAGQIVYGIFNAGSRPFVENFIRGRGDIEEVVSGVFPLKKTFFFHKKEMQEISVEIIIIRRTAR